MAPSTSVAPHNASLVAFLQQMRGPQAPQPVVSRREPEVHKGARAEVSEHTGSDAAHLRGSVDSAHFGRPVARRSQQGGTNTGSGHAEHAASLPELSGHGQGRQQVGPDPFASPAFNLQPREEVGSLLKQSLAVRFMSGRPAKMPRSPAQDLADRVLKATADSKLSKTHSRPLKFPLSIYA